MIISGVKVLISGDYNIEGSKSATEYDSRMLALWGSWMISLVEVDGLLIPFPVFVQ